MSSTQANIHPVELENEAALAECFAVMRELRGHLSYDEFVSLVHQAAARDQYQLIAYYEGSLCIAVMGYRILYDLVHGRHLYIDDLVVTELQRNRGLGGILLDFAEEKAATLGCSSLRLCTGIDNEEGKRFYEKNEWRLRAVAYKKKL